MKKACVIGHPISHSLSPVLHGHWLTKYGIDGEYSKVDVSPEELPRFIDNIRSGTFNGCNVTLPHKEKMLALVDKASDIATRLGAANTLWMENGRLHATNTDGFGFMAHLEDSCPPWKDITQTALVIGAGGASRAVIDALCNAGVSKIILTNRTLERAESLASHFSKFWPNTSFSCFENDLLDQLAKDADLIVNTTSLGMTGQSSLDINLSNCAATTIVYDLVYSPLETPLLAQARSKDMFAIDGLGMLLHQGRPGFEKWFGTEPDVDDALRQAILAAK